MKKGIILLFALLSTFLISCETLSGQKYDSNLVGRWTSSFAASQGLPGFFTLTKGGGGSTSVNGTSYAIHWNLTNGNTLEIVIFGLGYDLLGDVAKPDMAMKLDYSGGNTLEALILATGAKSGVVYTKQK